MVLAEEATEVAAGKEDRSRTAVPHEFPLLAEVGRRARKEKVGARSAKSSLAGKAAGTAPARTESAMLQQGKSHIHNSLAYDITINTSRIPPSMASQQILLFYRRTMHVSWKEEKRARPGLEVQLS